MLPRRRVREHDAKRAQLFHEFGVAWRVRIVLRLDPQAARLFNAEDLARSGHWFTSVQNLEAGHLIPRSRRTVSCRAKRDGEATMEHSLLTISRSYLLKINRNLMNNVRRSRSLNARGAKFTKQSRFAPVLVVPASTVFDSA